MKQIKVKAVYNEETGELTGKGKCPAPTDTKFLTYDYRNFLRQSLHNRPRLGLQIYDEIERKGLSILD